MNKHEFINKSDLANVNVKSSAKREYRDENVFLKGDRALSKLITFLISNKKEFNHFFESISSEIVLLKLGNLYQNAKSAIKRATLSAKFTYVGARSATIIRSRLILASCAR